MWQNNNGIIKKSKAGALFAILALSVFTVFPQNAFAVNYNFDPIVNISGNAGVSEEPQIKASGSNVYLVWQDGTDIHFSNSTDSGASFDAPIALDGAASSSTPQLAVSGNNIYAVWQEGTSPSDIVFIRSTDNGDTFEATQTISASGADSVPKINATGTKVYLVWQDGTDIYFSNSTNSGASFDDSPLALEGGAGVSTVPQLATAGNNIYVVWKEGNNISFIRSTDDGDSFFSASQLSTSGSATRPVVAASGNSVYAVWQDTTNMILKRSTDKGASFGSEITLGTHGGTSSLDTAPKIAVSGNNIYVVWRENNTGEISFVRSTDGGATFESKVNLSDNSGSSILPQIAAIGDSVAVVWRDSTPGNTEIFFRASDNNGEAFGSSTNLSSNSDNSETPQVAITSVKAYVVWDDAQFGNRDILFVAGTPSPISITFDKTQYTLNESALITIVDPASDTTGDPDDITVRIKSTSDTTGIDVVFSETGGSTDTFTNTISFDRTASSAADKEILAKAGDTITALLTGSGDTGTASIFPITIDFKKDGIAFIEFDYGHIVNLEIDDKNANLDAGVIDTINVDIASTVDSTTLTLDETGVNTGLFGGTASKLIFMVGDHLFPTSGSITVSQENSAANTNTNAQDTTTVKVNSTSDAAGITLTLTETDIDSDIFSGTVQLSSASSPGSAIEVAGGDILSVTSATVRSNALITPNPNADVGAIEMDFPGIRTVTATYSTADPKEITVQNTAGPGGGGGGLVRPGLVLDVIAGISALGGGRDSLAPLQTLDKLKPEVINMPDEIETFVDNFDPNVPIKPTPVDTYPEFDFPLAIDSEGYPLAGYSNIIETHTLKTNEQSSWKLAFYESTALEHVSLYMNLRGVDREIYKSDTQILYYKDQPLTIIDPHGYFDKVDVIFKEDGFKKLVSFDIIFAKPMETSDLIIRSWDERKSSFDTIVQNAIEVLPNPDSSLLATEQTLEDSTNPVPEQELTQEPIPEQELTQEPVSEEQKSTQIPAWVKTNADWWAEKQIGDSEFISGVEFLIKNDIIKIPDTTKSEQTEEKIPEWIRSNAEWWADGQISDDDFVGGLQYLISHGIIKI